MGSTTKLYSRTAASALARTALVALVGLAGLTTSLAHANSQTELKLTVLIRKHASLQVLSQPSSIQITGADVARGYVEVATPVQVAVKSNTEQGYLLVFDSQGDFFRQARVRGLSTDVQLGTSGGTVAQSASGRGMNQVTLALAFRFELAPSAREGVYAWPMQLSAMPL
jgi:hypothetical protein